MPIQADQTTSSTASAMSVSPGAVPNLVKAGGKADESRRCGPLLLQLRASNRLGRDARLLPRADIWQQEGGTQPPSHVSQFLVGLYGVYQIGVV
jgi:hypothetical protein